MNLSQKQLSLNKRYLRLKPSRREGLRIQYWIKDAGKNLCEIGCSLDVVPQVVSGVVSGDRHSARVEAEIARILGKADWNEVVLEARSAVTGKPVQAVVKEIRDKLEARAKRSRERLTASIAQEVAAAKSGARRAG